ncbi:MAG: hypothetical protein IJ200_00685 [Prevotella sp.]|nr:hypothetical protein [Prevotella sp.]
MKKYNKPAMQVVKIETHKMLAESTVGFSATKVDASQAQGRQGFFEQSDED